MYIRGSFPVAAALCVRACVRVCPYGRIEKNGAFGFVTFGHRTWKTDLTRSTRAPHFTPQHWLLCHMGLY